jgi:polyisoprenoid-binding protein YceI
VKEENGKVIFTIKMTSIDTGIELRNHHMCDKFAECEKYPTATLTIERSALPIPTTEEKKVSIPARSTRTASITDDGRHDGQAGEEWL